MVKTLHTSSNILPKELGDCGMAKSSEPIKLQDSNTPTLTPYKAFSRALLLCGANVRGAAGSDKRKHLE